MSRLPTGKLPAGLLGALLASLPPPPPELRLPPRVGEDACAIDVPEGTLVVATDPITLTGHGVGAHAAIINANDVAVTGVRPRWFLASVLLPVGTDTEAVRALFDEMRAALVELDVALVGGHTEVTAAVNQVVVTGQMLGITATGNIVATGGAQIGDAVVQAGPAPVEGAAVLAVAARARLGAVPEALLAEAERALRDPGISVVAPALRATELGAHALHDPTEGGLAAGLDEMARAAGVALRIDAERVLWFAPGVAICNALGADPWGMLASGCLLAAFAADRADAACDALTAAGTPARVIGSVLAGAGVTCTDGRAIAAPARDEVARVLG